MAIGEGIPSVQLCSVQDGVARTTERSAMPMAGRPRAASSRRRLVASKYGKKYTYIYITAAGAVAPCAEVNERTQSPQRDFFSTEK